MRAIGYLLYLAVGLIQFSAIISGLESWWGLHWIIAGVLAFFIAYIPVLGAIVGMVGAMDVWHWEWWQAGGLFFGVMILTVIFVGLTSILEWFSSRRKYN
ncbi:hypothetical protein CWR40_001187 [Cronobacter sakazakii]|uniref:Uncharacterized protein n=1 Tax=Cronobacter sakazakii TaxID=28141 RepID=A0A7V7UV21_CROSK|nr:hypothetical protein [Cronobacter sakazakii]AKE95975.1 hypothetical protein CSK29544_03024 [Cronobacter sakazakii]EGT4269364.1 hypothetical protein [Cronobacter sakazakii]EGT4283122.1 hypothetical protein [Cronobacter sakazakii]EGT4293265.1 hypothetical protein [Cronobacter sakazakii]EIZ2431245.1 hypothetical protein [Cronobacter sakazakii]